MATYQYGSRGSDVKKLQQQLKSMGYNVGAIDGIYGNQTKAAVQAYQKKYGLATDGIYGKNTAASMAKNYKPVSTVTKPKVTAPPKMNAQQQSWWNNYTKSVINGTNDYKNTNQLKYYNDLATKYGLKKVTASNSVMQQMSLKALQGDPTAQAYMKAMGYKGLTGSGLWGGYKGDISKEGWNVRKQYMLDNPTAAYTKTWENGQYKSLGDKILNNQPLTDQEIANYNKYADKWNLQNVNDPYVQQQMQLEKDKQGALSAQDVQLNQGLGQQDAQNFQMYQQLAQDMSNRGLSGSGMAADAYMRATMGANQNYQQAFADATKSKSDITAQYNDAIAQSKIGKQQYDTDLAQQQQESAIAEQKNQTDLMKIQSDQDKWLTTATGTVYLNGKQVKGSNGKPITTLDWQKMTETQRHNIATEGISRDSNSVKREQIAADLQKSIAQNKLDYAKLDYNYDKLEANNKIQQDKIKIASDNAQTSAMKGQITGLGKQLDNITKQITAYQKKGKKPPKSLVDQYNSLQNQISSLVGGSGF